MGPPFLSFVLKAPPCSFGGFGKECVCVCVCLSKAQISVSASISATALLLPHYYINSQPRKTFRYVNLTPTRAL